MKTKLLLLPFLFLLNSCTTEELYQPDLNSEHSVKVNIKGVLYVSPSGERFKDVPVDVSFYQFSEGLYSAKVIKKVVSGKTDSNGEFNFNTVIDTTSFENSVLEVKVPQLKNYIYCCGDYFNDIIEWNFRTFNEFAEVNNMEFVFYKKTSLTVNLNRVQDDYFDVFSIDCYAGKLWSSPYFDPEGVMPKTVQIETAADIYTKIIWEKKRGDKWYIDGADSLICKQNTNNVLNINY